MIDQAIAVFDSTLAKLKYELTREKPHAINYKLSHWIREKSKHMNMYVGLKIHITWTANKAVDHACTLACGKVLALLQLRLLALLQQSHQMLTSVREIDLGCTLPRSKGREIDALA